MTSFSPRLRLAALAVLAVVAVAGCAKTPKATAVGPDDMARGPASAKVEIIEYASVACPICAKFNDEVMPDLNKKYITPGKVHYIYRPMLTGAPTVAASGQLLAQCAGKDKFFTVADAIMKAQGEIYANGENDSLARPVLLRIAKTYGIDEDGFNKCITDAAALTALDDANTKALKSGITGTPTFFINGKKMDYHGGGIAEFDAALKPLLDK